MGFPTIRRRIHFAMNKLFTLVLIALFSFSAYVHPVFAVTGVPEILSHQGRLLDTSGNLLGGSSGTNYCFRFSFYDDATVGGGDTKLWPTGTPSTMTVQVKSGVFNVGIGDTSAGGDALDFDFESNDSAYLNTEVAAQVAGSCAGVSFENLSPRQRVTSSGFAVNASTLNGRTSSQSATGDDVVALTSDDLILGGTSVDIGATGANTLTLQGNGATGAVQFFSSSNSLSSTGNLDVAGTLQSGSSNVALTLATGFVDADALTLTTSGTTGATSSNSGLEAIGDGLTLLKGCSDGQILKYTDAGGWACAADASGGGLSDNDYGDITVSLSGSAWTIDNGVVTSAKISDGTIADGDLAAGTFSNITGTGALGAGSITSGFGAIDIGADNFTTTGIVNTDALTLTNTGTLNGLDVLDATSETTIEGAIDTLANLTSIQGNSFTVAGSTTISGTNTGDQTSVTGNAGTVTFADAGGDTTTFVVLGTSATGSLAPATDAGLTYNATTNALTATTFIGGLTGNVTGDVTGNLTGNVTGNVSGSSGSTTGNAATATALAANPTDCGANAFATTIAANGNLTCASITDADVPNSITIDLAAAATALATPRNINGVAFDGTADITVAAAAGTLTGTTLASNIVTSSLTTVGALDAGSITSGFGAIDTGTDNITTTGTVSTNTLTLTGTGTLNGLDVIDATGEATLETALDIAGDVTGTGLSAVVIADNAVDGTDIALGSDAQGDLMYYDGTNWVRLAAGNAGEVLQTGGAGADPSWVAAAAGDILAVGDVSSGAAFTGAAGTTLTFDDADGDQTFAYDTTNNEFDISDDVFITGTLAASGGLTIDGTTESNIESAVDIAGDVDGTGLGAVDLDEVAVESELESVVDLQDLQGAVTDVQVPNNITIDSATTAGTVTFADAGGDTTTFVALGTSATGSLAPATDAGLSYNATTDALTAGSFVGGLTGNASTATALAANPTDCGANTFATTIAANGNLTCASITDADVPNTITIDLATLASTVTVVDSTDATSFIAMYDDATGSLAPKTDGGVLYDASNGTLSSTVLSTATLTLTGTGTLNGLDAIDGTTETTLEAALELSELQGSVTDGQVPNTITVDLATSASDLTCTNCIGATEITDLTLGTDTAGNYVASATASGGLVMTGAEAASLAVLLPAATNALSSTTSSGSGLETLASGLAMLQGCSDGQVLVWVEATDTWDCTTPASGTGDITAMGDVSSGAAFTGAAGTTLTFDDADGDQTFAYDTTNNEFDISDDVSITGALAASGGLTVDATTESNIEAALDTLSNVTTVGALDAGSITSNFGTIDTGTDSISTTGTVNANNFTRSSAGALTFGDTTATSVSVCNSAACDTITIGSNADVDTITIGDAANDATTLNGATVAIDTADWDITTTGAITGVAFDANGSGNSITNIETGDVADNTLTASDLAATVTFADDDLIDLAAVNNSDGAEGLILPQNATACSAAVAEGQICWDTAGEDLYVGNGATAVQMNGGAGFDSTTVDNTTWSDNANASNVWTFDVSGTDTTMTFGNGIVTFSNDATVTGVLATTGGLTIDATTEGNIETALDTLSNVTTVGALGAGSITSGFGAIDTGADNITTTGTASANDFTRSTAGALTFGDTTATSVSICNSADCDTITIGSNADADTITIGDSTDTGVSITDNNWSIGTTGIATFVNALVSPSATTGIDTGSAGALSVGNTTATSTSICNSASCDVITIGTATDNDTITIGEATDQNVSITDNNWSITVAGLVTTSGGLNVTAGDIGLADTTGTTWSITSAGVMTLAGGGDGTNNIVLTTGDIQLTDGDFDMLSGDFNVTLDNADTASFTTNSAAAVDGLSVTLAGTADAAGIDGLFINATASNQTNQTVNALNISLAAGGTASGDIARGIFLDLASVGNALNTTKAVEIENTTAWDTDIELQNDETIDNAVDGVIGLTATTVDISGALEAGSSDVSLTLGTGFIDADSITLISATDALTSTTSASGLAVHSDGLTLLQGCSDAQVLSWVESTDTWDCTTNSATLANGDKGDITIASGGASMTVDFTMTDGAGSASSAAGIEEGTGGIALLQGCSDQQILKWTEGTSLWECAADSNTGSISADSLNFTEFSDTLAIDAATEINLGAFAFTIDLDSSGDFSVRDGSTDIATFVDSGAITFAPTAGQAFTVTEAAGTGFNVTASAAPTVDQIALTNSGFGTTTAGVDGMAINFVTGDGANNTNSGLDITLINGGTASGDILRGITLNNITPTAGTETGLYIGTGFDYDIQFGDTTATIQLADRGTLSIVDGSSGVGTLLAVGSPTSRGDLDVYGNIVKKGYIDQTAITNINDVFVYDTAKDTDAGAWTNSNTSQGNSWFTETKDDGAGDLCDTASDDRCGTSSFPKKAILVAASDALYIFDAHSSNLWMKFTQVGTYALGADTNNNPSSVFAQNGTIYVGTNGASGTGMYEFDFTGDKMFRYNTTDMSQADVAIGSRNTAVTYNVNSKTNMALNSNFVNDVHATTIMGGSNVLTNGGPLNGVRFIVAGTDDSMSVVNTASQVTYDYGDGAITDNYQSVFLTRRGRLFGLNSTDTSVDRFGLITTSASLIDTAQANVTTVSKRFNSTTRPATLWKTAPTFATNAPDALDVSEQASLAEVDTVATGRGDVLYVGHSLGLTEIHDTNGVSSATVQPWSKFYTTTTQTDYMPATNKGMYSFEEASGDLTDMALTNNVLEPENAPTYGVNGVRGKGLRFDGANDFLCSDVDNNAACDVETDFASTTTAFNVSFWFKTNGTVSAIQTLVDKSTTTAAGAAGTGWRVWLTATGTISFGIDDDTAFTPDDVATSTDDFDDSQWHHVFAQRTNAAGRLDLFVDGRLVGNDTTIAATLTMETAASVLSVGARCNVIAACTTAQEFFNGDMDDLVFTMGGATTTDTMNQAQVRKIYLAGLEAMKHKTIAVTDATSATSTTIVDTGETWIPNEFVGQIVEITEGTGVGQTRRVTSNTATSLTVSPAWSTTPDTTSDFAIEPEFLYGSSNIVSSVAATTETFMGRTQSLYVGTDSGADGGGMTVFSGFGNTLLTDVYHGDSEKTDNSGTEWTGSGSDNMEAIDLKSGILVSASDTGIWVEMPDTDIQQSLDSLWAGIGVIRAELIADGMQASGLEFGAVGSADLAEFYYSNEILEPGDVVAIQPDQPAGIGRSANQYQKNLLGVVSTAPALTMGASAENAYAIALAGRIPVKITDENGLVHVGDELTASSKPGYAMKATKAGAVLGRVINEPEAMASCEAPTPLTMAESVGEGPGVDGNGGLPEEIAWTDSDWQASDEEDEPSQIDEPDPEDPQCGYAMVFIGLSDSLGKNIDELADEFIASDAYEPVDGTGIAVDDPLKNQKEIMAFLEATNDSYEDGDKLESLFTDKIAAAVEIIAPSIYTKGLTVDSISSYGTIISMMNDVSFFGRPYFNADTAGFAVILEGAKKVDVHFTVPYLTQPVVSADISFENANGEAAVANFDLEEQLFAAGVDYIVTRKSVDGFTILLNKPAPQDMKFSWIALAVNGAVTTEGAPTGDEVAPIVPVEPVPEPEVIPTPTPEPVPEPETPPVDDGGGGITPDEPAPDTIEETVDEPVITDENIEEPVPENNNPPVEEPMPTDGVETDAGVI